MAWSDLTDNKAVSWHNMTSSGIPMRNGGPYPNSLEVMTRAEANSQLNIMPIPNDNKLALKRELVLGITYYVASTGTDIGFGYAIDQPTHTQMCGLFLDGPGVLYTTNPSGVLAIGDVPYIMNGQGQYVDLPTFTGFTADHVTYIVNGTRYSAYFHVEDGDIRELVDCSINNKPTVYIGATSINNRTAIISSSRPVASNIQVSGTLSTPGGVEYFNLTFSTGQSSRSVTASLNLNDASVGSVSPMEDNQYKYIGVGGVGQFPIDDPGGEIS